MPLASGDPAPDFTLPDQSGDRVTLSQLRGGTVVLHKVKPAEHDDLVLAAIGA